MKPPPTIAPAPIYNVDDDDAVLESTAFLLDACGFECATFASAETFLARAGALAPGCVLTDLRMPGADGWALLAGLRGLAIDWPVVLMSSDNVPGLADRARISGFKSFVPKPVDGELLSATIRQALADSEPGNAA